MDHSTISDQKSLVEMVKDTNGLDQVLLREPGGASARVHLFGGQVTSWKNDRGEELLFTSSKSVASSYSEVRIEGLETLDYLDNLQDKKRCTEQGDAITFESEVDRVYLSTPTKIAILDHEKKRTFVLRKDGLADAVVWNPWEKKAKSITDFGDDEYKHMLCVDGAAIEKPITLKPGEEWKGRLELSAVPSSYCSGQLDPQRVLQG